jgi:hypothetical protein
MTIKEFELKYKPLRRNSQDTDAEENEFVLNYGLSKDNEHEWELIRQYSYENTWSILNGTDNWLLVPGYKYLANYYVIVKISLDSNDEEEEIIL